MKCSPLITRDAIDCARSQARWIFFLDENAKWTHSLFCYFDINLLCHINLLSRNVWKHRFCNDHFGVMQKLESYLKNFEIVIRVLPDFSRYYNCNNYPLAVSEWGEARAWCRCLSGCSGILPAPGSNLLSWFLVASQKRSPTVCQLKFKTNL